jgi:hypothetical protein
MFDINTSIFDEDSGELDDDLATEYIDQLMAEFRESPEAEAINAEFKVLPGWPIAYMDLAVKYIGETPATMSPMESDEIVFELFPRKVSVEADKADEIIGELRAFWNFLKRTRSLAHADEILESLSDDGAQDLRDALSDPSNFGMAKSIFMQGNEAGFDMTTAEGMNQFVQLYNASLAGQPIESIEPARPETAWRAAPLLNDSPRIGRNDPCPCGSGRKYKKCCLR